MVISLECIIKSSINGKKQPKSPNNINIFHNISNKNNKVNTKQLEYNYESIHKDILIFEQIINKQLNNTNTKEFIMFLKWQYPNQHESDIINLLEQIGKIIPKIKSHIELILSKYSLIKILHNIPTFMGLDGRPYKLYQNDVATIPHINAELLIKKKMATRINSALLVKSHKEQLNNQNYIPNPYNQCDTMTKIRTAIGNFNGDISQVKQHAIDQGISPDIFTSAITKMQQEGSIFEYKTGYYKLM